jgi:sugar lactone lactonase YvrE
MPPTSLLRSVALGGLVLLFLGCTEPPAGPAAGAGDDPAAGFPSSAYPGLELVVPPSSMHGVHGITVTPAGEILVGSVVGQAMYRVDPVSGAVTEEIGPPDGMTDDLEVGPDGTLAWTGFLIGKVFARSPGGEVRVLAADMPQANSLAWSADGRLFVSQVFGADAVWELDPSGAAPPRKIVEGIGGFNGFDVGPDGWLYGPVWFRSQVARIDPASGTVETVAEGFGIPAAANFDSNGDLWVVDTERGEVVRVDVASGAKQVVARTRPSLDNLAFSAADELYVTNMADNGVYRVDTESGEVTALVEGALAMPAGLSLWEDGDRITLYVADTFAYRTVDAKSKKVETVRRMWAQGLEGLDYPLSSWVDSDHVVLAGWSSGTVQVVDRASGESLRMIHGFAGPTAALELPDERLVVAEAGTGRLLVVSPDGDQRETLVEGLAAPAGLDLGGHEESSTREVFVTESASGAVSAVALSGGARRVVAEGLSIPEGIDHAADGRLVVAEVGKRRLIAIDPTSGAITELVAGLPIGLPALPGAPPSYVTTGVAVAADGSVFFTSDLENAIYRLPPG